MEAKNEKPDQKGGNLYPLPSETAKENFPLLNSPEAEADHISSSFKEEKKIGLKESKWTEKEHKLFIEGNDALLNP